MVHFFSINGIALQDDDTTMRHYDASWKKQNNVTSVEFSYKRDCVIIALFMNGAK